MGLPIRKEKIQKQEPIPIGRCTESVVSKYEILSLRNDQTSTEDKLTSRMATSGAHVCRSKNLRRGQDLYVYLKLGLWSASER